MHVILDVETILKDYNIIKKDISELKNNVIFVSDGASSNVCAFESNKLNFIVCNSHLINNSAKATIPDNTNNKFKDLFSKAKALAVYLRGSEERKFTLSEYFDDLES